MGLRRRIANKIDELQYDRVVRREDRQRERKIRDEYYAETIQLKNMSETEKSERTERIRRFVGRVAIVPNLYHVLKYEDERAYKVRDGISDAVLSEFPTSIDTFTIQTIIGQKQEDRYQQFALCRERIRESLRKKAPERTVDTQDVYLNTVITPRGFGWLALSNALGEIETHSRNPDTHGLVAIVSGLELPKTLLHPIDMHPGSVAVLDGVDETGLDVWRKVYGDDPYAHLTNS
jgi:hypothetical protein